MNLKHIHNVYFIGIGGIGMSALARYFNGLGKNIFGYDKTETELTRKLVEEGMQIHYNDLSEAVRSDIDLVVYTPAIPGDHGELNYFKRNDYPVRKRAEVLGIISRSRKTIGVAGTHGKTSTSAILAHLLKEGGIDCTAFLGGIALNFDSNFVSGNGPWVVVEADEYDRSFLHLDPDIAIVLSMDADHLDIYGNADQMKNGFSAYAGKIKDGGKLFLRAGLPELMTDLQKRQHSWSSSNFGINDGAYRAENIRVENESFVFDFYSPIENLKDIVFHLPGNHNVENAAAAIAVAQQLAISGKNIKKALASFKGIKRRFERIYKDEHCIFIDDYAHHPTELDAAILAARMLYPKRTITGVFQPHLYSRTSDFAAEFAAALDQLDEVILLEIYPARELPIKGVTSKIILEKMKNKNASILKKDRLINVLKNKSLDVLLTLGAGDIGQLVQPVKAMLKNE